MAISRSLPTAGRAVARRGVTTFGEHVRRLRTEKGIGQRELARALDVSPSYVNDIEKDKRVAPRPKLVKAMAEILDADAEHIFDLAGRSRNTIPPDVGELVLDNPEVVGLLRAIADYSLSGAEVRNIKETMMASNTRVLIIAAGLGSRMKSYTTDKPKCLLDFGGKTLLQRQLRAYRACGAKDIALVRGYKKDKIKYKGIRYHDNPNFENNNILNSIFCAEEEINGHVIISYSDILFEDHVVHRLLESEHDISIVVDIDWKGTYIGRKQHPIDEAENVVFDANNTVVNHRQDPDRQTRRPRRIHRHDEAVPARGGDLQAPLQPRQGPLLGQAVPTGKDIREGLSHRPDPGDGRPRRSRPLRHHRARLEGDRHRRGLREGTFGVRGINPR